MNKHHKYYKMQQALNNQTHDSNLALARKKAKNAKKEKEMQKRSEESRPPRSRRRPSAK